MAAALSLHQGTLGIVWRTMHPSVIEEGDSLKFTVSQHGFDFGCPLCPIFKSKSGSVIHRHLSNHLENAVHFNEKIICRCNLQCRNVGHFHCPFCGMTIIRKDTFTTHVTDCQRKRDAVQISSVSPSETTHPAVLSSVCVEHSFSIPLLVAAIEKDHSYTAPSSKTPAVEELFAQEEQVTLDVPPTHVKCPHCPVVLYKRNLFLHIQRKHGKGKDITAQSHLKSALVDQNNGLYAVRRTSRGLSVPVHVQCKTWGQQHVTRCEMEDCLEHNLLAQQSGLYPSLCHHIRSLDYCDTTASEDQMDHQVLQEMVENFLLDDSKAAVCKTRQREAEEALVPLSILVDLTGSKNHIYLSIHEPKLHFYSTLGRVFVTHSIKENTWHCPCCQVRVSCVHKCIAKWHLFQTRKHLFKTVPPNTVSATTTHSISHPTAETETSVMYVEENQKI